MHPLLKKIIWTLLISSALLNILFITSPVEPVSWQADPSQELSGVYAKNEKLREAKIIDINGDGPEDLVFDADGHLYTGLSDGLIIKLHSPSFVEQTELANTQGRPLGMRFDKDSNLIIADAIKGLIKLDIKSGQLSVLADSYEQKRLLLVDHLDIAANGDIYFSDASARFDLDEHILDFIEASSTGRVFKYDIETQAITVVADNLFFANGVALGPNDEYLLINETGKSRIMKVFLSGEKKGTITPFISSLPGLPDNIYYDENGTFWLGLITLRDWRLESLAESMLLRRLIAHLPLNLLGKTAKYGMVLGISVDAEIKYNLQASDGVHGITSAIPHQNSLYLGFLKGENIAVLDLR